MVVTQAASEFQGSCQALKDRGELLDGGNGGVVVLGGTDSLPLAVGQGLCAGKGDLLVACIKPGAEIVSLGGEVEDAGASCRRKFEPEAVGLALIRIGGDLHGTVIPGMAVGIDHDAVVFGIGVGEGQGEGDTRGVPGACCCGTKPQQARQEDTKNSRPV